MRNQEERAKKYAYLRNEGKFSSKEANNFKDRKWSKIKELAKYNVAYIAQRDEFFKNQTKKGE